MLGQILKKLVWSCDGILKLLKYLLKKLRSDQEYAGTIQMEVINMMYPYMTLSDETEVIHSHLIEENGEKKLLYILRDRQKKGLIWQDVNYPLING